MPEPDESTTKSGARKRRRSGRPASVAKRQTIGLTEVQLEAVERQLAALRAADPKGRSVSEADALRTIIDAGIEALGLASDEGVASPVAEVVGAPSSQGVPAGGTRVALTDRSLAALDRLGECFTGVEKALRHPLGTNVNQVARHLNTGGLRKGQAGVDAFYLMELVDQVRGLRDDVRAAHADVVRGVLVPTPEGGA